MHKITAAFILLAALSCKPKENIETAAPSATPTKAAEPQIIEKYKLSLAEWSLHKTLFDNKMTNMQFAEKAASMGFSGIEYVNTFFKDKAENKAYLDSLNMQAKKAGVSQVLIMVDGEGDLGDKDEKKRIEAVNNHKKWITAAEHLGCHSIRVNAFGDGRPTEVAARVAKSLKSLGEFATGHNVNVIIENHGGYSSDGKWLSGVMKTVNMPNVGTLPDFGNFCLKREKGERWGTPCLEEYDRYQGVSEILPFAKGVSAKSYDFDAQGNDTKIDYAKMLDIVKASAYNGFIGVEYEGEKISEDEGIMATKALLVKLLAKTQ